MSDWSALLANPVFAGGLGLGALGVVGAYGRQFVVAGVKRLATRFYVTAEIRDYEVMRWISRYFEETGAGERCRRFTVSSEDLDEGPRPRLAPGVGTHFVRYNGRRILLTHTREETEGKLNGARAVFTLRMLGRKSHLDEFMREVFRRGQRGSQYRIFANDLGGWELFNSTPNPRPFESLVLRGDLGERLLQRAQTFFDSRDLYASRSVPWTEGWWFYGVKGTGKSSIARALASELNCPLYVLGLTGKDFRDDQLARVLGRVPRRSILLIEELDVALQGSEITPSGLRQALDGPIAGEGRLLIIATNGNHLDPSLRRPGRIDLEIEFGAADRDQARRMFLRFFPGHDLESQLFAGHIPEGALTPAEIQRYLMGHSDPRAAALAARTLAVQQQEVA